MGRPKSQEAKKQYTVMLKPSIVREMDRLADKLDLSRSQLIANLVESGLDDAKILERIGAFKMVMVGGKVARGLKHKLLGGQLEIDEAGELRTRDDSKKGRSTT
jgi:metal-responsive CopG/Arc/MetJ family transcriptional regulator